MLSISNYLMSHVSFLHHSRKDNINIAVTIIAKYELSGKLPELLPLLAMRILESYFISLYASLVKYAN
jgi:hypothetical protein